MKVLRARLAIFLEKRSRLISLTLLSGALFFGGLLRLGSALVSDGVENFWRQNDWPAQFNHSTAQTDLRYRGRAR